MENYPISIIIDNEERHFEVGEYLHQDGDRCKFRVFESGAFVASFHPDEYQHLHVCTDPGVLDEALLDLLADEIETHHPHGINKNLEN